LSGDALSPPRHMGTRSSSSYWSASAGGMARITAPIDLRITGSFEADLTLEDAEAFKVRLTEMAPVVIDCTEVFRIALVRSG
jgi:hypothetical protein